MPEKPLLPNQKYALLRSASHAQRQTEAYFDMIADAAILASNQVQDKRLDMLEAGPEVTGTDILLEVLLSVLLSSNVAGIVIGAVTKKILDRVLSTRRVFMRLSGRSEYGKFLFDEIIRQEAKWIMATARPSKNLKTERSTLINYLLKEEIGSDLYSTDVYATVEKGAMIFYSGVEGGATKLQKAKKEQVLSPYDTPGTAIIDNALTFALRQKTYSNITFDEFRNLILLDQVTEDDYDELMNNLVFYRRQLDDNYDLNEIKREYALYFEASIWVNMYFKYDNLKKVKKKHTYNKPIIKFSRVTHLKVKDEQLTDYLMERLYVPDSVMQDKRSLRRYTGIPPNKRVTFGELARIRQKSSGGNITGAKSTVIGLLVNYLVELSKETGVKLNEFMKVH